MKESLAELTGQLDHLAEIAALIGEIFVSLRRVQHRDDFLDHAEHQYPKIRALYGELVSARETVANTNAQMLESSDLLSTGETKILKKRGIRVNRKMRLAQLQCRELKVLLYKMVEAERTEGARDAAAPSELDLK